MARANEKSAKLEVEAAEQAPKTSKKAAIKARLRQLLDRQPIRDEEDACYIRSSN